VCFSLEKPGQLGVAVQFDVVVVRARTDATDERNNKNCILNSKYVQTLAIQRTSERQNFMEKKAESGYSKINGNLYIYMEITFIHNSEAYARRNPSTNLHLSLVLE
jgi:hypothetical protein